jgi:hypothetical protein
MLRAWTAAAEQYHACRNGKRNLADSVATYEREVWLSYCADLRAAGLEGADCAAE